MQIRKLIERFIRDNGAPHMISLVKIEPDEEKLERYRQKVEDAKRALGPKYVLHHTAKATCVEVEA